MEKIVEVKNLTKKYGDFIAVDNITFDVEAGTMLAFLGPNGAGKSTTINMLSTMLEPTAGEVKICGYDLLCESDMVRSKLGIVFQESLLDNRLTIRENLMVRASFYSKNRKNCRNRVEKVIELTDMSSYAERYYGRLSGGQRRRADIARALLNEPKILFLDEPTTGLDPQTRRLVWDLIVKLQSSCGMTVFLTTHYMEEAAKADRVTIIDDGKIVVQGTPEELKQKYSFDVAKVVAKDYSKLEEYMSEHAIAFKQDGDVVIIPCQSTCDCLELLSDMKDNIQSCEILHGTMDDVFINITGKEIRE